MPRALSVTRVRVAEARQAEWLAVLAELERLERAEGRRVWVFRHPEERDVFLEFSESGARAHHRAAAPAAGAAALEGRLRELGSYDDTPSVIWDEVSFTAVPSKGS